MECYTMMMKNMGIGKWGLLYNDEEYDDDKYVT